MRYLLLVAAFTATAHADPVIVDKPISWTAERERLTLDYRRAHEDAAAADTAISPRMIVLHHTGGSSWQATWRYFDRTRLEAGRAQLRRGGEVNVSAHYLVARDGTIRRLMPETRMARHCIGLNHVAIGIENVGGAPGVPLTTAQVEANAALVRALVARYPITHLIGHHESRAMEGHRYWRERDPAYRNRKSDPGEAFLLRVRMRVLDLLLAGPPRAR